MDSEGHGLSEPAVGTGPARVSVRFADDEVLAGRVERLDLDQPDFELIIDEPGDAASHALIPLPSVKSLSLGRRSRRPSPGEQLQTVSLRFQDGEVVRGRIAGPARRGRYGVTIELVSESGDEVEVLGIPYASLRALLYARPETPPAAAAPPREAAAATEWSAPPLDAPLIDLLAEVVRLGEAREGGGISDDEFRRRRDLILDMI